MKEFGSDFHYIKPWNQKECALNSVFPLANYYADGRQALITIYRTQCWERLWVPEYYCYDVLKSLISNGLNLAFYRDYPGADDDDSITQIPFKLGDALLRVNYYGIRGFRSNNKIKVPVVEDHTHDLIGEWATNSDADWCIASLRKTLPIAEGGILWSPLLLTLPPIPQKNEENEKVASSRWAAMRRKEIFLSNDTIDKSAFRQLFIETESFFDDAEVSSLDEYTSKYLQSFDILKWYNSKKINWQELNTLRTSLFSVVSPENEDCYPFSFIILCKSKEYRDILRCRMIQKHIYPAILWKVPESSSKEAVFFSERMLSIHCDARYSQDDTRQMKELLRTVF